MLTPSLVAAAQAAAATSALVSGKRQESHAEKVERVREEESRERTQTEVYGRSAMGQKAKNPRRTDSRAVKKARTYGGESEWGSKGEKAGTRGQTNEAKTSERDKKRQTQEKCDTN